jgi:dihydrodipicolinate synthase/N-acetylneuraminate lyase
LVTVGRNGAILSMNEAARLISGGRHRTLDALFDDLPIRTGQVHRLRGADGAMTGFAYPEMMARVVAAHAAGEIERMRDIFDAYLPLVRYESQPGLGLAVRKYILARRGAIAHAALRKPGGALNAAGQAEVEALIARQERRLAALGLD